MQARDMEMVESAWIPYDGDPEWQLRLRSVGGPELDRLRRQCRPVRPIGDDDLDLQKWVRKLVEEVLLDWRGYFDGDDEVPFSKERALLLCKNITFATWLGEAATKVENFVGEAAASDRRA